MRAFVPFEDEWALLERLPPEQFVPFQRALLDDFRSAEGSTGSVSLTAFARRDTGK